MTDKKKRRVVKKETKKSPPSRADDSLEQRDQRRSEATRRKIAGVVRACWSMEMSFDEIADSVYEGTGETLSSADVAMYVERVMREATVQLEAQDAGVTYIRYTLSQLTVARQLNDLIKDFSNSKQYNALVGALRAKSDIIDRVLKVGQDMGFVRRVPEGHFIVSGQDLRELTQDELVKRIASENERMETLTKELMTETGVSPKKGSLYLLHPKKGDGAPRKGASASAVEMDPLKEDEGT